MKYIQLLAICLLFISMTSSCNSSKKTQTAATDVSNKLEQPTKDVKADIPPPPRDGERPSREEMQAKRAQQQEALIAKLDLSAEQEDKYRKINAKYREKIKTMREKHRGSGGFNAEMRDEMMAMRDAHQAELATVLTKDQLKIYVEEREKMRQNRPGRGPGGPGGR